MKHIFHFLGSILTIVKSDATNSSVFEPVREEQVPSGLSYDISQPLVEQQDLFAGKRVAILASHGVEEDEIVFPYEYLAKRGAVVDVLVPEWTPQGIVVSRFLKPTLFIHASGTFQSGIGVTYDLIVLTGGAWNSQVVRNDHDALALVSDQYRSGRALAAICSGTTILINAGLAQGTIMTGSPAVRIDLVNAGAKYFDEPLVMTDRLATSRTPDDLPAFITGLRKLLIGL